MEKGIRKLFRLDNRGKWWKDAAKVMGIPEEAEIFNATAYGWPEPFRSQWNNAKTYKGEARAAVNLLKAILKTDGAILEEPQ